MNYLSLSLLQIFAKKTQCLSATWDMGQSCPPNWWSLILLMEGLEPHSVMVINY